MGQTGTSQIVDNVDAFYDRTLLRRAIPLFLHRMFAQQRPIPRNAGSNTIRFRRYANLAAATTAISEGQNPTAVQISTTEITATTQDYGNVVEITSQVDWVQQDDVLTEISEILGDNAGDTLDQLTRDELAGMTSVIFPGAITVRTNIGATDYITAALVKEAGVSLKVNKAKRITRVIKTNDETSTYNIRPAFVGFVHPYITGDLQGLTGWKNVEDYPSKSSLMEGEVGALHDTRFIESTNAKIYANGGSGAAVNVYKTIILGTDAYGTTMVNGEGLKMIRKPFGSAGALDALNRYGTSGWIVPFVAKRLNELFMTSIESSALNG